MSKIIEFVCTGNHGRSPVAELIAHNYLTRIRAISEYASASSGTLYKQIADNSVPLAFKVDLIQKGIKTGFYSHEDQIKIYNAISRSGDSIIDEFYKKLIHKFSSDEDKWREDALAHFGIEGKLKDTQDQTIALPDRVAVLSMAESNNAKVKEIYLDSGFNPIIDVLGNFATYSSNAPLPNAFGKNKDAYFAVIETLMGYVPKAVDRVIHTKR